jgi:hypothetical protein
MKVRRVSDRLVALIGERAHLVDASGVVERLARGTGQGTL